MSGASGRHAAAHDAAMAAALRAQAQLGAIVQTFAEEKRRSCEGAAQTLRAEVRRVRGLLSGGEVRPDGWCVAAAMLIALDQADFALERGWRRDMAQAAETLRSFR